MKTYCIEVHRELEDIYVFHKKFKKEPNRKQILEAIQDKDINYDDDYGKFKFWEVK